MTDFMFPTEVIQLPSQGKVYPEGHPLRENGGKLDVKYMTAKEEDILTNTNLIQSGTVVDKLLDSLVIHKGVKHVDLTTGDVNAVLMASRVLAYGKDYPIEVLCISCGTNGQHTIDLSQLQVPDEVIDTDEKGHHSFVTETGLNVTIRMLTRGDEMQIEKNNQVLDKKLGIGSGNEVTSRLKKIIVSINGVAEKNQLSKIIDNLIIKDSKFIRSEFEKINPSIDMTTETTCEQCGHVTKGGIPLGINFLWPDSGL